MISEMMKPSTLPTPTANDMMMHTIATTCSWDMRSGRTPKTSPAVEERKIVEKPVHMPIHVVMISVLLTDEVPDCAGLLTWASETPSLKEVSMIVLGSYSIEASLTIDYIRAGAVDYGTAPPCALHRRRSSQQCGNGQNTGGSSRRTVINLHSTDVIINDIIDRLSWKRGQVVGMVEEEVVLLHVPLAASDCNTRECWPRSSRWRRMHGRPSRSTRRA